MVQYKRTESDSETEEGEIEDEESDFENHDTSEGLQQTDHNISRR